MADATRIPAGEMPVVFPRLNGQDTDGSHSLNLTELLKLDDDDLAAVFKYGHDKRTGYGWEEPFTHVTLDHAVDVFQQLPPEKRTFVLRSFSLVDPIKGVVDCDLGNEFLTRLAAKDLPKLADDLARDFDSEAYPFYSGYVDSGGNRGFLLLRDLDEATRSKIMEALQKTHPAYADEIRKTEANENALKSNYADDRANETSGNYFSFGGNFSLGGSLWNGEYAGSTPQSGSSDVYNGETSAPSEYSYLSDLSPAELIYMAGILKAAGYSTSAIGSLIDTTPLQPTHATVVDALKSVVDGHDYRVFGFGEEHIAGYPDANATNFEYFASDIVPYLVREQKVTVIGVEWLWTDCNDDIDVFMRTGKVTEAETPDLFHLSMGSPEWDGTLTLLQNVRSLRQEGFDVTLQGVNTSVDGGEAGPREITENTKAIAQKAIRENKKVALYNGSLHNEVSPEGTYAKDSYMDDLGLTSDQLLEVDFVVPDYYDPMSLDGVMDRENALYLRAPQNGVVLDGEGNSYNIVVAENAGMSVIANDVARTQQNPLEDLSYLSVLIMLMKEEAQYSNGDTSDYIPNDYTPHEEQPLGMDYFSGSGTLYSSGFGISYSNEFDLSIGPEFSVNEAPPSGSEEPKVEEGDGKKRK